jgi:hypothetical protein
MKAANTTTKRTTNINYNPPQQHTPSPEPGIEDNHDNENDIIVQQQQQHKGRNNHHQWGMNTSHQNYTNNNSDESSRMEDSSDRSNVTNGVAARVHASTATSPGSRNNNNQWGNSMSTTTNHQYSSNHPHQDIHQWISMKKQNYSEQSKNQKNKYSSNHNQYPTAATSPNRYNNNNNNNNNLHGINQLIAIMNEKSDRSMATTTTTAASKEQERSQRQQVATTYTIPNVTVAASSFSVPAIGQTHEPGPIWLSQQQSNHLNSNNDDDTTTRTTPITTNTIPNSQQTLVVYGDHNGKNNQIVTTSNRITKSKPQKKPSPSKDVSNGAKSMVSTKAKELERIKEEARILAQYAEFSRRVLEQNVLRSNAKLPTNENVNTIEGVSTTSSTPNKAVATTTIDECQVQNGKQLNEVSVRLQTFKKAEIESRANELEKIKEEARRIAQYARKIIVEDVPAVLTVKNAENGQSMSSYGTNELDVSSISDPATLLEFPPQGLNNNNDGDVVPVTKEKDIESIREEARRIAQYTNRIIAGGEAPPPSSIHHISHNGLIGQDTSCHNDYTVVVSTEDGEEWTQNDVSDSAQDLNNDSTALETMLDDPDITEDEVRIRNQYKQFAEQINIQDDSNPYPQSVIDIDSLPDSMMNVGCNVPDNVVSNTTDDNKVSTMDNSPPLDCRNSLGEFVSEERAKELERIKEEARRIALAVRPPVKGAKKISVAATQIYESRSPANDYVLNPNDDRSNFITFNNIIQNVTWPQLIADSELISIEDVGTCADSVVISIAQFKPCALRIDDRIGRYLQQEVGYIGLCCKHCFGQPGYGRYFPSTLASFISSFPSTAVKHIIDDCYACPKWIKDVVSEVENMNQKSAQRRISHSGIKGIVQNIWEILRSTKAEDVAAYDEVKKTRALHEPIPGLSYGRTWGDLLDGNEFVRIEDRFLVPDTLFAVFGQYEKCVADNDDCERQGRFRSDTLGFAGICCRHCKASPYLPGSRLFPSNALNLQLHDNVEKMIKHISTDCPTCPASVRIAFNELEAHDAPSVQRYGSKKIFFRRLWMRLHGVNPESTICDDLVGPNPLDVDTLDDDDESDVPIIQELIEDSIIIKMTDRGMVADAHFVAYGQLRPCRLEQMDKAGWYKDREIGFPGVCCKHCGGRPSSGRYFPRPSDNFLRSSKNSIVRHLTDLCKDCPDNVRNTLIRLQQKETVRSTWNMVDDSLLGAGKSFHHSLWVRLYEHFKVPHGYYEALDYSNNANPQNVNIEPSNAKKHNNTTSPQPTKKRKVEYGRTMAYRKTGNNKVDV